VERREIKGATMDEELPEGIEAGPNPVGIRMIHLIVLEHLLSTLNQNFS
jgi:hypothetical protein